jgi:hypothetical protein
VVGEVRALVSLAPMRDRASHQIPEHEPTIEHIILERNKKVLVDRTESSQRDK